MKSQRKTSIQTVVKPNKGPHHSKVRNNRMFNSAYNFVSKNPRNQYRTTGNNVVFSAKAVRAIRGCHLGQKVIIFYSEGKERGRAYPCCWGFRTNCNRTWISCYTQAIPAN
jgi:hypothetical protein